MWLNLAKTSPLQQVACHPAHRSMRTVRRVFRGGLEKVGEVHGAGGLAEALSPNPPWSNLHAVDRTRAAECNSPIRRITNLRNVDFGRPEGKLPQPARNAATGT